MSKRKRKILIATAAVIVVVFITGQIDFHRLVNGKEPVFARLRFGLLDGGSSEYMFLGYTVTATHQRLRKSDGSVRYRTGPKLDYWIPFLGRDATNISTNR